MLRLNASSSVVDRRPPLVLLAGPTAVGKTTLAVELAQRFPFEIVSVDSRQIYRQMDIGTAKPSLAEQTAAPHHLLNLVDPDENFTGADFQREGSQVITEIHARKRIPLLVGGTGLYWKILLDGLVDAPGPQANLRQELATRERQEKGSLFRQLQQVDPLSAAAIPPGNLVRIVRALEVHAVSGRRISELQQEHCFTERPYRAVRLGLYRDRHQLYRRIDQRVESMLEMGLEQEVEGLLQAGFTGALKSMRSIGYQEMVGYFAGKTNRENTITLIKRNSRHYAKRQLSWMRRDNSMIWLDSLRESDKISAFIGYFIA